MSRLTNFVSRLESPLSSSSSPSLSDSLCTLAISSSSSLRMVSFSQSQIPIVAVWLMLAEVPASEVASASCNDLPEDIWIFAIVMAELELSQVQRQILLADVVIRADDSALEQSPERFNVICVNLPANISTLGVSHRLMWIAKRGQVGITLVVVVRDERNLVAYSLADKVVESAASVFLMIWQTTLPLRLIAPITVVLTLKPVMCCFLRQ
jgi:hypothetical protein